MQHHIGLIFLKNKILYLFQHSPLHPKSTFAHSEQCEDVSAFYNVYNTVYLYGNIQLLHTTACLVHFACCYISHTLSECKPLHMCPLTATYFLAYLPSHLVDIVSLKLLIKDFQLRLCARQGYTILNGLRKFQTIPLTYFRLVLI